MYLMYALKLENKNSCHGKKFLPFFHETTSIIIKFFIGINMMYKFGKNRWKIVTVRGLSFRTDGRTDADCFYIPLQRCWQGITSTNFIVAHWVMFVFTNPGLTRSGEDIKKFHNDLNVNISFSTKATCLHSW